MSPMDYATFEKYIDHIRDASKWLDNVYELFNGIPELPIFGDPIELLAKIMGDKDGWIEYWIYDLNFGANYKSGDVVIDGKNIPLYSSNNLYRLLIDNLNRAEKSDDEE